MGHISRDCPVASSGPRGGGRGGGFGRGNLDVNIDGRMKADIWQILKEFQENPALNEYSFPPDLSNTERRYIHTACRNLNLTSKSTGGSKKSDTRYIVVYKGEATKEANRQARRHPLSTLAFRAPEKSIPLVDGFLDAFPLPEQAEQQLHPVPEDTEVDLQELAAKYTPRKSVAEIQALSKQLQELQEARAAAAQQANGLTELQSFRARLPIAAQKDEILRLIDENQVLVLSSSTGSGKSTQVPQYLLDHLDARGEGGRTDILVTQPRRISAISLAQRVAEEREVAGDALGDTVGYQIRLESRRSHKTRLLYCTIGVLLRRLSADRLLSGVSHLIVDEVHERDRLGDFLLVVLRDLLPVRKDLKIILMSATLNADLFSRYFNGAPHLHIEGFTHPVHTFYLEDVIELVGYVPGQSGSLSKVDASKRRQQADRMKEKRLADQLNFTLAQLLTLESDQDKSKKPGAVLNPSSAITTDADAGGDDEAALAALASIASMGADPNAPSFASLAPSNKVTGWTDTWTYKPEVENPWAAEEAAPAAGAEANMLSALDAIVAAEAGGAPAGSASSFGSASAAAAPAAAPSGSSSAVPHPSVLSASSVSASLSLLKKPSAATQNPLSGLKYSQATLDAIAAIEAEGMDYVDYELICAVIEFICNKFDASLLQPGGGGQASADGANGKDKDKKAAKAARAAAASAASDEDAINIYNGSILVFVPGWEDICKLLDLVQAHPVLGQARKYLALPLHGSISTQQQRLIFQRPQEGQRKIIFSTNIAETSVTIDDVVFVIDAGKMKEKSYDAFTKMCALSSTWVSQSNAKQRSGRAGRCRRGVCFRLYSTGMYENMSPFQTPELLRTPLEELCLQVKSLKLGKIAPFLAKALQPPSPVAVLDATDLLTRLGALEPQSESLTLLGEYLASMPLDPRLAKMVLYGAVFKCLDPVLTIAACLSYRDPFVLPVAFERERAQQARQRLANGSHSDMLTLLNAFHAYQVHLSRGGPRSANDFARNHFLSVPTLQMIAKMKGQFMEQLKETGWLDHLLPNVGGGGGGHQAHKGGRHPLHQLRAQLHHTDAKLNTHQHNLSVLNAVLCLGLYPMCARVQVQSNTKKKRRALLCTRNDLHNVCLHPSCVSCKDFRRAAGHASAWTHDGRINLSESTPAEEGGDDVVQYLVFFESMRSSEIFLRGVHWVQPILLALFGTGNRAPLTVKHQLQRASPSPSTSPDASPPSGKKAKSERNNNREDANNNDDEEDGEDDDDIDDDDEDEDDEDESASEPEDDESIFHADEWVRFTCLPENGVRFAQLRRYVAFIVDCFIRRSGSGRGHQGHGKGHATTSAAEAHLAEQSVEFLVKLLSTELAPHGGHHHHRAVPAPVPQQQVQQQNFVQNTPRLMQRPQQQQQPQHNQQQQQQRNWQPSPAQPRQQAPPSQPAAAPTFVPPQVAQRIVSARSNAVAPPPAPAAAPASAQASAPLPAASAPVSAAPMPSVPAQALSVAEVEAKLRALGLGPAAAAPPVQQQQQQHLPQQQQQYQQQRAVFPQAPAPSYYQQQQPYQAQQSYQQAPAPLNYYAMQQPQVQVQQPYAAAPNYYNAAPVPAPYAQQPYQQQPQQLYQPPVMQSNAAYQQQPQGGGGRGGFRGGFRGGRGGRGGAQQ